MDALLYSAGVMGRNGNAPCNAGNTAVQHATTDVILFSEGDYLPSHGLPNLVRGCKPHLCQPLASVTENGLPQFLNGNMSGRLRQAAKL